MDVLFVDSICTRSKYGVLTSSTKNCETIIATIITIIIKHNHNVYKSKGKLKGTFSPLGKG